MNLNCKYTFLSGEGSNAEGRLLLCLCLALTIASRFTACAFLNHARTH